MSKAKWIERLVKTIVHLFKIGVGIWGSVLFSLLGLTCSILHLYKADDWCFNMVLKCEDYID